MPTNSQSNPVSDLISYLASALVGVISLFDPETWMAIVGIITAVLTYWGSKKHREKILAIEQEKLALMKNQQVNPSIEVLEHE